MCNHFTEKGAIRTNGVWPGGGGVVHENPTNADILHLDPEEANRLAGSIMNDFSRELLMVNYIFNITYYSPGPHDILNFTSKFLIKKYQNRVHL